MQVYKTSHRKQIQNLFWYVVGGVFLYFVIHAFTSNLLFCIGVPLVIAGYPIYSALFSDNISFEITDNNHLIVKCRGKVTNDFKIDEIQVTFKFITGSDEEFWLYVTDLNDAKKHSFDCELLGEACFRRLITDLGAYNPDRPVKVRQTN